MCPASRPGLQSRPPAGAARPPRCVSPRRDKTEPRLRAAQARPLAGPDRVTPGPGWCDASCVPYLVAAARQGHRLLSPPTAAERPPTPHPPPLPLPPSAAFPLDTPLTSRAAACCAPQARVKIRAKVTFSQRPAFLSRLVAGGRVAAAWNGGGREIPNGDSKRCNSKASLAGGALN